MPYGTVNLRHGVPEDETTVTCTAGVGTFLLEFGTLSRLTGDPVFERVALRAVQSLHSYRSEHDLVGNHINTSNGAWVALDSTIGAGVDSYFEYLVKGTFLLKNPSLMDTFFG
jgi:mannosidase alpha-like ER degradation enhancer 2